MNLGPLEEQSVLFTAEPSLQPPCLLLRGADPLVSVSLGHCLAQNPIVWMA